MGDNAPIVFIHYGPSRYLRWTLRAAVQSNPGKKIYFLGDDTNKKFVPHGVDFLPFASLEVSPKLQRFRQVFRPIEGNRHRFKKHGGTAHWIGFVFERWFLLESFARVSGLARFWTFDSDTMVAADLLPSEKALAAFEATEQCRGCCLNGLVNSVPVVGEYTSHILRLYSDDKFLAAQSERLATHSGLAFNEMDAWQHFRELRKTRTRVLGKPREGEVFDDALAMVTGFVPARGKVSGRIPVKKVELDRRGGAFAFLAQNNTPVRLVTLNLSWLPDHIFTRVLPYCQPTGRATFEPGRCRELKLRDSFSFVLKKTAAHWRASLERAIKPFSPV